MVGELVVSVLTGIFQSIISILPAFAGFPDYVNTSISFLFQYLTIANAVYPVYTLLGAVAILFVADVVIFGWRVSVFFYDKIPFKNT